MKSHGETTVIYMDQILYIEGNHNYQTFYLEGDQKPVEVRELISTLEETLKPYGFIRVHKGFIVNWTAIYKIGTTEITLKGDVRIPLSQQRREEVLKLYLELTKNSLAIS